MPNTRKNYKLPTPNPTSIFLSFQGPWLFHQVDRKTLKAVTFGQMTMAMPGDNHACYVGKPVYADGSAGVTSPVASAPPNAAPLELMAGGNWTVTIPSHTPKASFEKLFLAAFAKNPFAWIKGTTPTVTPLANDRTVTLPMPTSVYVAGRLLYATLDDKAGVLLPPKDPALIPQPYVTTIFEYALTKQFTLAMPGSAPEQLALKLKHLAFRMEHQPASGTPDDASTDMSHVLMAHTELMSRVTTADRKGKLPITLGLTIDTSCELGLHTAGLQDHELGLIRCPIYPKPAPKDPSGPKDLHLTNYANCAGAGGPVGP